MQLVNILKKPIITEKSLKDVGRGIYTFAVDLKATKPEIGKAVEKQFKVKVLKVKTLITAPTPKRKGKRRQTIVYSKQFKKAYVRLAPDQKIELFEQGKK